MRRHWTLGCRLWVAMTFCVCLSAWADVPGTINYQGYLTDADGVPVADGGYDMIFRLFEAATGGTATWTETHDGTNQVAVSKGRFSAALGGISSFASAGVDFSKAYYLEIQVGSEVPYSPRLPFNSVPYAMTAKNVTSVDAAKVTSGVLDNARINFAAPAAIGSTTPSTGTFTTLNASAASLNADGAKPNANAALDVASPAAGDGKGMLIPRVTAAQRSTASSSLAGGLLNDSGALRGGAAQGLLVYQTDGAQGLYHNTSSTATPTWIYLGAGSGTVTSVTAGAGLSGGTITTAGTISLTDTGTAGTYAKVTTDSKGRVTAGTTLSESDIPNLSATKITSGTLGTAQIPSLSASKITSGTFGSAQIPDLPASKITSGTLGAAQIPSLPASKITSGMLDNARVNFAAPAAIGSTTPATGKFSTLNAGGASLNADGSATNANAVLDVASPSTGDGKGMLIPRVTAARRTTASSALAGGLLNDSGALRGGAAQGLVVYQTDGTQGFYYNTSATATPTWVYLGAGDGTVTSVTAGAGLSGGTITTSGTISLPDTGTAGTYAKVTTDGKGRVTAGTTLSESDIPNLSATKITSGTLGTAQIPNLSATKITSDSLALQRGGLGADVSAYNGLVQVSGGAASSVTATNAGKALLDDADSAAQRTTLGLGSIATQNSNAVAVTGGTVNGASVGATTPSTGAFTTLSSSGATDVQGGTLTVGKTGTAAPGKLVLHDNQAGDDFTTTLQSADDVNGNWTLKLPAADGTANQLLKTDGSGQLAWTAPQTPVTGTTITIGDSTTTSDNGVALGVLANGTLSGNAIGYQANASSRGVSLGYQANGYKYNTAIGYQANGYAGAGPYSGGVAVGYTANAFSGNGKYSGGTAIGYMANARHNANENDSGAVAVGFLANGFVRGVAMGYKSAGNNQGAAVGYLSTGSNYGSALGYKANAGEGDYATAIGYMANGGGSKNFTFAKGAYSKCERYNEEWKSSDGLSNKFGYGQLNFHGATTTALATEIYLGGSAGKRFTLRDNSGVTFQALVTGVNTTTGDTSGWRCWGVIKRRSGAATTSLVAVNVETETQGGLSTNPTFDADTTNGALRLKVTGVNANTCVWNAMITYSEVRESATQ